MYRSLSKCIMSTLYKIPNLGTKLKVNPKMAHNRHVFFKGSKLKELCATLTNYLKQNSSDTLKLMTENKIIMTTSLLSHYLEYPYKNPHILYYFTFFLHT